MCLNLIVNNMYLEALHAYMLTKVQMQIWMKQVVELATSHLNTKCTESARNLVSLTSHL